MSAAYKCDRCGELYLSVNVPMLEDIPVEKIAYGSSDTYSRIGKTKAFDICQKCAQDFIIWFKEPALADICSGEG